VLLYGVTAFLFNHPTAFGDHQSITFGRDTLRGTPMEHPPTPRETAEQVVAALRERAPKAEYALADPAGAAFSREFAFATVKTADQEISLLFDAKGTGGTVRTKAAGQPTTPAPAPFAVGRNPAAAPKGKGGGENRPARPGEGLTLPETMADRVKSAVPTVLEKHGLPAGEVTVTSVPEVTFLMTCDGQTWKVTYNPLTGSVSGNPAEQEAADPVSPRRFLTRLHTTHGYPGEANAKWAWAVVVDAMAFVMLFWGVSGLFMWWQIKATRRWGAVVLVMSFTAAAAVGAGMYEQIAGR